YGSKRKTVKVDDEQGQHSNLNAGRNENRGYGIAQESLNVPPIELSRDRRLEEFVVDVRTRHIRAPFAIAPEQRFRQALKPTRTIRRIWRSRCWPPRTDALHSCEQGHCDQNNRQHGDE